MKILRLVAVLFSLATGSAWAQPSTSNLDREKNWADQVVDSIVVGEAVWLSNRGHRFLSIYAPPARPTAAAVLLIHGRGVHPAWGFIDRLRADIAENRFHTLSIQMPILSADAPYGSYGPTIPEALERIQKGIEYLKTRHGVKRIVLLGHSSGSATALAMAARRAQPAITGVVAIGTALYPNSQEILNPLPHLEQIRIPVIDIHGQNDLKEVSTYNKARRDAARANGARYSAVQITGADHFYTDHYDQLKAQVLRWLFQLPAKPST